MKIGITGCAGRMGREVAKQILESEEFLIAGGIEKEGSLSIGWDIGELAGKKPIGIKVTTSVEDLFKNSDVVIDFSFHSVVASYVDMAVKTGKPFITGTTGFDEETLKKIDAAAKKIAILKSPNMSLGINLLLSLTKKTAEILGEDFDIEILEMHHNQKVDAPSGTALSIGRAAANGRGSTLEELRSDNDKSGKRTTGKIGFAVLRGGDVAGDHDVIFAGEGERLILSHKASSRSIFAKGALKAAGWIKNKKPGLYSMIDVLNIN